jgi:hypothetical protein
MRFSIFFLRRPVAFHGAFIKMTYLSHFWFSFKDNISKLYFFFSGTGLKYNICNTFF